MGIHLESSKMHIDERWLLEKMKRAYVIKECLDYLQTQAIDGQFHFSASLIASASASLDEELRQITQIKLTSAAGKNQVSKSN